MVRSTQVLIIGYSDNLCTPEAYDVAYKVGRAVARRGAVVVTGGLGGVMEAACKGASDEGGTSVAIIPQEDFEYANRYATIVIPTGLGYARDFVTAYSADVVIIIGGAAGTLIEASAAYLKGKPLIAVAGSGGTADRIAGSFLDERSMVRVEAEPDAEAAVERALAECARRRSLRQPTP